MSIESSGGMPRTGIGRSENAGTGFANCRRAFLPATMQSHSHSASRAEPLLWTSLSQFETAEYHFYAGLSHAASFDLAAPGERQKHAEALAGHYRQIEVWAQHCPDNFANRAALLRAEIARIEDRALDAMELYEQAIRSAQANGFVQNEALAYELAARFYAARGFEQISDVYLRTARYRYVRWGADGKVRQLDRLYPYLRENEPVPGPTQYDRGAGRTSGSRDRCQGVANRLKRDRAGKTHRDAAADGHRASERGTGAADSGARWRTIDPGGSEYQRDDRDGLSARHTRLRG